MVGIVIGAWFTIVASLSTGKWQITINEKNQFSYNKIDLANELINAKN